MDCQFTNRYEEPLHTLCAILKRHYRVLSITQDLAGQAYKRAARPNLEKDPRTVSVHLLNLRSKLHRL